VVAELARETGALVIVFATLPFSFEGKRRAAQAEDALSRLGPIANAVICFENDRMGDMVAPKAGIHQAFAAADVMISQSVRSIVNLIQRPGLIRIGFDDLLSALRSQSGRSLFGFGESDSDNRAHDALTQALKNPLMDKGRMLSDASNVLVQVAGGPGMTLSEVEILMQELGRHVRDKTQILFGTAVDGRMGNRLSVTIISSIASEDEAVAQPAPIVPSLPVQAPAPVKQVAPAPPIWEQQAPEEEPVEEPVAEAEIESDIEEGVADEVSTGEPEELIPSQAPVSIEAPIAPAPPPPEKRVSTPRLIVPKKKPVVIKEPAAQPEKMVQAKQEVMQFEPVTRGRFEKSEPTIVEGQDLDVPTYLRKNIRVK
jgi:cell division GTPase FtsZ